MKWFFLISIFTTLLISSIQGNELSQFKAVKVLSSTGIIWGMAEIEHDQFIFTQRNGEVFFWDKKKNQKYSVKHQIPFIELGQGGLLDVCFYQDNLYFTYSTRKNGGYTTELAALRFDKKKKELVDFKILFTAKPSYNQSHHFGSRVRIFKDQIFLTIGDRGNRKFAQDLSRHNGKVLRLNLDGSPHKNNPFFNKKNNSKEIFSYGHRNPQGLAITPEGDIYEMEHGPQGGDEINLLTPGSNYGWPLVSYGEEYGTSMAVGVKEMKGTVQPLKYYIPSIAPSGLVFYTGEKFPKLSKKILSGALKYTHVNVFDPRTKKEFRLFSSLDKRVRNIIQTKNGGILFSTDSGEIYEIMRN